LLSGGDKAIYVEVKNTTLLEAMTDDTPNSEGTFDDGIGYFPDSVSDRASKHLRELMLMVEQGHRGVIFFCVNHSGIKQVRPADHIDPLYGKLLREAAQKGVEILAYRSHINEHEIYLKDKIEVVLK